MIEPMMCDIYKFNALCDVLNIPESERENALSLEIRIAVDEITTYKIHKMASADKPAGGFIPIAPKAPTKLSEFDFFGNPHSNIHDTEM